MLSAEWEHWGDPRWHQERSQLPFFVARRDSVGTAEEEVFADEVPGESRYWSPAPDLGPVGMRR